jgi:hypothetical protein
VREVVEDWFRLLSHEGQDRLADATHRSQEFADAQIVELRRQVSSMIECE